MDNVFVDACALLDIFNDDECYCDWAMNTLSALRRDRKLVINTIIFTEVSLNFESSGELSRVLGQLSIDVLDIPLEAAFYTGRVFKQYRKNKGGKRSPMPDFYIGSHARFLDAPIVTRDLARYQTYFPEVELIASSHQR